MDVQWLLIKYFMQANYFQNPDSYKYKHPRCLEILLEIYNFSLVSRFGLYCPL